MPRVLVLTLPNGRPVENHVINKEFTKLKEKTGLPYDARFKSDFRLFFVHRMTYSKRNLCCKMPKKVLADASFEVSY